MQLRITSPKGPPITLEAAIPPADEGSLARSVKALLCIPLHKLPVTLWAAPVTLNAERQAAATYSLVKHTARSQVTGGMDPHGPAPKSATYASRKKKCLTRLNVIYDAHA